MLWNLVGCLITVCLYAYITADEMNCVYNNEEYKQGDTFSHKPGCSCKCPKSRGRPVPTCYTGDGKWKCVHPNTAQDMNCIGWQTEAGSCCPVCVQRGCRKNSVNYNSSENIPTEDPCLKCKCNGNYGSINCFYVDRAAKAPCVDVTDLDKICGGRCPNGPNCRIDGKIVAVNHAVEIAGPGEGCITTKTCYMEGQFTRIRITMLCPRRTSGSP